jgi:hypothetical protein
MTNGSIKVKWDAGRTSYFRRGKTANVKLKEVPSSGYAPQAAFFNAR